jgi:CelD/BcsL family acetyltransferase involved in cellulose biosynthesis
VRKPQRCPEDLWKDLARRDDSAVFFQTPEWHALALRDLRRRGVAGAESHPFLFEWDGGRAALPLLRVPGRLHEMFQSPFGTYTALLSDGPVPTPALGEIAAFLRGRNVDLFSSPHTAHPLVLAGARPNATYLVDLRNVDVTRVEESWANNQRRHFRNGVKAGLTVRTAEGAKDVEAYYRVYEKTLERWGGKARSRYSPEFFRDLWDTLGGGPMRLWLAESAGRVVGGDVCFYHNRHAVQWHGVVDAEFFKAGATQALLHAIIGDAARRGFSVYDMNPSGGLSAVESFKKDFGSRRVEFPTYRNLVFPWSWARGLQERLFRR